MSCAPVNLRKVMLSVEPKFQHRIHRTVEVCNATLPLNGIAGTVQSLRQIIYNFFALRVIDTNQVHDALKSSKIWQKFTSQGVLRESFRTILRGVGVSRCLPDDVSGVRGATGPLV